MKTLHKLLLLFLALAVLTTACLPADLDPTDPNAIFAAALKALQAAVVILAGLGGVATLVAWLVDVMKRWGWVKDGQAPTATAIINLVLTFAVAAVVFFSPNFDFGGLDDLLKQLFSGGAPLITVPFLVSLLQWIEKLVHSNIFKGSFLAYSYTERSLLNLKSGKAVGQALVEYALILVLVAIVVIAVLTLLGPLIANIFTNINSTLNGTSFVPLLLLT